MGDSSPKETAELGSGREEIPSCSWPEHPWSADSGCWLDRLPVSRWGSSGWCCVESKADFNPLEKVTLVQTVRGDCDAVWFSFLREWGELASGPYNLFPQYFCDLSQNCFKLYFFLPCWVLGNNCFQLLQVWHAIYNNFFFWVNLNTYWRHDTLDEEGPVKFLGRKETHTHGVKCLSNCPHFPCLWMF